MKLRTGAITTVVLAVLIYAFRAPSLSITKVNLENKVYLVTGCTIGGIGYETAMILAGEMNATVLCTVRSKEKGEAMMHSAIPRLQAGRGKLSYSIVDFASFQSVRAFAQQATSTLKRLDGVVLNAGMHAPRVQITEDGLNQDIQVNHYSQFLLTRLLEDLLVASAPSRLVFISSGVMYNGVLNRTLYEHTARPQTRGNIAVGHMQGLGPYEDSKLMNVLAANAFAEHFRNRNVDVVATSCAPGTVATNAFANSRGEPFLDFLDKYVVPMIGRTAYEGAARGVQLVSDPQYRHLTGVYVGDYLDVPMFLSKGVSAENARWLWRESSLLLGLDATL